MPGFLETLAFRPATAADVPALATLYATTARTLGPHFYTAPQVDAWCQFGQDTPAFRAYVLACDTWLATDAAGRAVGFCGVFCGADTAPASGELRSLYVHHGLGRRGLGSRLLDDAVRRAQERGAQRLAAWVTPFSRPLFERAGFVLVRTVNEAFEGVEFERYRFERNG